MYKVKHGMCTKYNRLLCVCNVAMVAVSAECKYSLCCW